MKEMYKLDGTKVNVKDETNEYYLGTVNIAYYDEYEEYLEESNIIAFPKNELYSALPTVKKEESIEELDKIIEDKKKLINMLDTKKQILDTNIDSLEKSNKTIIEKLQKKNKALQYIGDFIDGHKDFYVIEDTYPHITIKKMEEYRCDYDKKDLKLLTLFGSSEGDLHFNINAYRDGSGYNRTIYIAKTYEEAVQLAQNILDKRNRYSSSDIESAKIFGLKLDKEKLASYYLKLEKDLSSAIEKDKEMLGKKEQELKKIKLKR